MPLFISDTELRDSGGDVSLVVEKADAFIRELQDEVETCRARADAASITAEQSCALLEQKYISLSGQFTQLENEKARLAAALDRRATELAQAQAQTHKLELAVIKKDSEAERLSLEVSELHKSKRELLEVVEQKSTELNEKNNSIKIYLDKILNLTSDRGALEAKIHEIEAEIARSHAAQARLQQEKELIQKHNTWLNEELTSKVNIVLQQRQSSVEVEAELSAKLSEAEKKGNDSMGELQRSKEKVKELEERLASTREELRFTKEEAASKEEHFSAEVATASRLADLYKQSSDEWRQKANELEGVIKALETHLNQVETDYKEKLQREVSTREDLLKEAAELKEKLEKAQADIQSCRTEKESDSLALVNFSTDRNIEQLLSNDPDPALELHDDRMVVPRIPPGISGTALAASLLRDGWSLAKIYIKYQEAIDAWRHERQGRKQSQAVLERVLREIEEKAEFILDERAEHTRMIEAYAIMEEKLQQSMSDQASLENTIRDLKADMRKRERDYGIALKEVQDLQTQVTLLLKECRDIQLRCGVGEGISSDDTIVDTIPLASDAPMASDETSADKVISNRLLTFKDIHGMVEQNCQLRSLVRTLSQQVEQRQQELKEAFDSELKMRTDEAVSKVSLILKKSEEQSGMIESLQGTLGMYRRLYEEELKNRSFFQYPTGGSSGDGKKDLRRLVEISQETAQKTQEQATERIRCLEEDIKNAKHEAYTLRSERDRLLLESNYARERLDSFMKDSENQRNEMNAALARNVEFSQLITEYQRRLRESSQKAQASEELARKLSVEVSVLEHEKDILSNAEKRVSEEVVELSKRVYRLQATLDTVHNVEEVRESSRVEERKRLEDKLNSLQREWAEAKQELQLEREHVRNLTVEKEQTLKQAMSQIESMNKDLANALRAVSSAEARAMVAEARCSDLEANLKKVEDKASSKEMDASSLVDEEEAAVALERAREEIERFKEDLQASHQHTEQFKCIAQANEDALQQIESAHEHFKAEADKLKQSMDAEISMFKRRITDLEAEVINKEIALKLAVEEKESVLINSSKEKADFADEHFLKKRQLEEAQICIATLKEDLEKEHQNWRTAQNNYERQVVLQAETIQELSKASQSLEILQQEVSELRKISSTVKNEYESSKVSWEMEKESLQSLKADAEQKYKESDEQNKLLLDRLEAMHIKIAEKERVDIGFTLQGQVSDNQGESDLQNVIRYLRRSKETADTEISLLKQERMRLQKQLESALQASETTQAALRRERENLRTNIYTDEEFRSLQCQVTEMNLLRESNTQLREENKRNFEECQELREKAHHTQSEIDQLHKSLQDKEIELDASQKELEIQKVEIGRWENRVSKLLEKYKSIDAEDYDRVKTELQQLKEKLEVTISELELGKKLIAEKQERISYLENEVLSKDNKLAEMEKKLQETSQAEATLKTEVEKFRKQFITLKRKYDDLTKEKQALTKQIEELRSNTGKKATGEFSKQQESIIRQEMTAQYEQSIKESENMLKEKDWRIQILEKTLERERETVQKEREELRKERDENKSLKSRCLKDRKAFVNHAQNVVQEKKKFQDEFESYKRLRGNNLEVSAPPLGELSAEAQLDERAVSYLSAVDQLEEASNAVATDVPTIRSSAIDLPSLIAPSVGTGDVLPITSSSVSVSTIVTVAPGKLNLSSPSITTAISTVPVVTGPIISSTASAIRQIPRQALPSNPLYQHSTQGSGGSTSILSQVKGSDDKEQKLHQAKSMLDDKEKSRKTGRRIIRPRIERTNQQDSAVEADGSEMEAETVEEGKSGIPVEGESQGAVHAPSASVVGSESASLPFVLGTLSAGLGARKRVHVASTSHADEEISAEQDTKLELAPFQKKARGMNMQEEIIDQGDPSYERTEKIPPIETTQEMDEIDNVANEAELKDNLKEELSEMTGNGSKRNLELEEPMSKRPRINRFDDSKFGKQQQAQDKLDTEEHGEVEKPLSSEKPKEMDEALEEDGCQLDKADSSEKRPENFDTPVQDVTEEVEMQLVEKQEPSTIVQSSIEILSGGDDNGKQQDEGLLVVELVDGADASASASKEPESQGVHSGLDVENEKVMTENFSVEAIEGSQISDTPDVEEGEIPGDLDDVEIASSNLDSFTGDIELVSHDEDKRELQGEGSTQLEFVLPSEEITETLNQTSTNFDQNSQQASVSNISDAALPEQSSQQAQGVNIADGQLDHNSQQTLAATASDAIVEDKSKVDVGSTSSEAVQENARANTRIINLTDRAKEGKQIRERERGRNIGVSPSQISRGRGRNARGAKRGVGLARGRGFTRDDSQGQ